MERMEQFADCAPPDWGSGYDHITVGCPAKDQAMADLGLLLFTELPIRHKNIILQPLLELVDAGRQRCVSAMRYAF